MTIVDKRYAEALFRLALQENALEAQRTDLTAVSDAYEANGAFRELLINPRNDIGTKKQVITNVFGGRIGTSTLNFLMLLLDKNRIKNLPDICADFVRRADEDNNMINITIMTAIALDEASVQSICEKLKIRFHAAQVKAAVKIDPSLIGGIKVAVGDKLFDASIKEKLSGLLSVMTV